MFTYALNVFYLAHCSTWQSLKHPISQWVWTFCHMAGIEHTSLYDWHVDMAIFYVLYAYPPVIYKSIASSFYTNRQFTESIHAGNRRVKGWDFFLIANIIITLTDTSKSQYVFTSCWYTSSPTSCLYNPKEGAASVVLNLGKSLELWAQSCRFNQTEMWCPALSFYTVKTHKTVAHKVEIILFRHNPHFILI